MYFMTLNKCTNVPYCDSFAIEEEWAIISLPQNPNVCISRVSLAVIFYKNTIFKNKIKDGALKGAKIVWMDFNTWISKRGLAYKEKKVP